MLKISGILSYLVMWRIVVVVHQQQRQGPQDVEDRSPGLCLRPAAAEEGRDPRQDRRGRVLRGQDGAQGPAQGKAVEPGQGGQEGGHGVAGHGPQLRAAQGREPGLGQRLLSQQQERGAAGNA